ncbi:UDP-glucosyltransferase 29-like [Cornus florida]|uniref:UDP-glucosyltransferase 29-like n=1 Tax=Cornus florida TaxID=4283 RepID=UPI00289FB774|nr:UDP-glucosyltransferase 29-like [Cornus florida]
MDTRQSSISVLMLPWLAHGHISPFLELAKRLADRNFHIYFCSTPINLSSIRKRLPEKYSHLIQLVELHLPSMPELPPHYHTTNGLPTHLMPTLKDAFEMASPTFSNILRTLNPDLVIYDYNQQWAPAISSSLDIPAVQFQPTGAVMASLAFHMLDKRGENYPFPEIPLRNFESLKPRQSPESSENDSKEIDRFLEATKRSCNIILIKTFTEIEGKYIEYLSKLTGKKTVPVGPLVEEPVNENEHTEIIQWLDMKEESSAVFVSFGSECFVSKEEMEEVARGVELSKVNFIWVVRFPVGEKIRVEEALPEGFLERVRGRGMVVEGWAPQLKILRHSSTGGFVSHCGWGSVMESMKYGVPIIGMPLHIGQPLNSRLMEEVGVGVEVMRDKNGRLKREEIAQVIRKVVVEENGKDVRIKSRELSEIQKLKGEGEIDRVVEELVQLCKERKK